MEGDYLELKTLLSELSTAGGEVKESIGDDYNRLASRLCQSANLPITEYEVPIKTYTNTSLRNPYTRRYYPTDELRTRGARLASRINHVGEYEYHVELPTPTSGSGEKSQPLVSVEQNTSQVVDVSVIMSTIIEITSTLTRAEVSAAPGSPEKKFIQKMKEKLSGIKDVSQLVTLITQTAAATGLSVNQLAKIFTP